MHVNICKLRPKSSFHLGTREGWLEGTEPFAHSDTLFSAICHNWSLLYGKDDLERFLASFSATNAPFTVSSVFPCVEGRCFFPVPKNQFPESSDKRKISWISLDAFGRAINGESTDIIFDSPGSYLKGGHNNRLWHIYSTPRVSISRYSGTVTADDGGFFQFGQVLFSEKVELFFLYRANDGSDRNKMEAAVRLMADEGLGGDRSTGKGAFEYPLFDTIELPDAASADAVVILSFYFPRNLPMPGIGRAYYELVTRKGYMFSPYERNLERKPLRVFNEGSVFPAELFDGGTLADVTPDGFSDHCVYRNGVPLAIPCRLEVK